MNEDLQINEAARLAGTQAPVQLSQERARAFVSKTIGANQNKSSFRTFYSQKPLYAWGSTVLAAAACFLIAFFILKPSNGSVDQFGQPGRFMENQSNHAGISVVDSTIIETSDSIVISVIETVE